MVRDLGILALLVVLSVLYNVYRLLTRRRRDREAAARASGEVQRRSAIEDAPIPGLDAYASSQGWAQASEPGFDQGTAGYIGTMLRNLDGVSRDAAAGGIRYTALYTGRVNGHRFTLGNAWLKLGSYAHPLDADDHPGSVCVVEVGATLPPLFVNLRAHPPFIRAFLKEQTLESDEFNRRFQVLALQREYAMDVISARVMELLLTRDDWVFYLGFSKVVCVCSATMVSLDDYRTRLAAVAAFVGLIPAFVEQDKAMTMPTLPDGTPFDPSDPASRDKLEAALATMTPDERDAFMAKLQAEGARFVAGMLGKDLPEGVAEDIVRRADERAEERDGGHSPER